MGVKTTRRDDLHLQMKAARRITAPFAILIARPVTRTMMRSWHRVISFQDECVEIKRIKMRKGTLVKNLDCAFKGCDALTGENTPLKVLHHLAYLAVSGPGKKGSNPAFTAVMVLTAIPFRSPLRKLYNESPQHNRWKREV